MTVYLAQEALRKPEVRVKLYRRSVILLALNLLLMMILGPIVAYYALNRPDTPVYISTTGGQMKLLCGTTRAVVGRTTDFAEDGTLNSAASQQVLSARLTSGQGNCR